MSSSQGWNMSKVDAPTSMIKSSLSANAAERNSSPRLEEKLAWGGAKAINMGATVVPPTLKDLASDVNLHLFAVNGNGDLVLLGQNGRLALVQVYSAHPRLVDLVVEPHLSEVDVENIHSIQFNRNGDRIVLYGSHHASTVQLPLKGPNLQLTPEKFNPTRFVVRYSGDIVEAVSVKSYASNVRLSLEEAKEELSRKGIQNIKSISQEIFLAKRHSIGYFNESNQTRLIHAAWHPLSDNHLVVMSDTEKILLYDCDVNVEEPEQSHPISRKDTVQDVPSCFCFGSGRFWDRFTLYILFSDGGINALCPIVPFGCRVKSSEIAFLKESTRAEIDVCRLNTHRTHHAANELASLKAREYWLNEVWAPYDRTKMSLPVSSIGKMKFVAPDVDSDDEESQSQTIVALHMVSLRPHVTGISDATWPVTIQGPFMISPKSPIAKSEGVLARSILALHSNSGDTTALARVFSTGHLELIALDSLIKPMWKSGQANDKGSYQVARGFLMECLSLGTDDSGGAPVLRQDPSNNAYLFCSHSTGVHLIKMPWLNQLDSSDVLPKAESAARHVFSVSPSMGKLGGIIGSEVLENVMYGHVLLVRLASGEFEAINLSINKAILSRSCASSKTIDSSTELADVGLNLIPFDEVLSRLHEQGISGSAKVTGNTSMSDIDEETLQFVLDRVKGFHEIDLAYIQEIARAIPDRLQLHLDIVKQQNEEVQSLRKVVSKIESAAQEMDAKFQRVAAIQENLAQRAAAVVQALRENQPVISKAERKYHEELFDMQGRLRRLRPKVVELNLKVSKLLRNAPPPLSRDGNNTQLPEDTKKMCYDVLSAEKTLLMDTKSMLEGLTAKLSGLNVGVALG